MKKNIGKFFKLIWHFIRHYWSTLVLWTLTFVVSAVLFSLCHLKSLRGSVSDSITISSIILAILGILLSMIISMNDKSEFVKRARRYKVKEHIIGVLFKRIMFNFKLNVFIIVFTLVYDVVPSISIIFLKVTINTLWATLFLGSIYEVLSIVNLIGRIYLFIPDKTGERVET
ncbi:MAG TPA: hypothetical protein H9875_08475 [Candidatus Levilactobacillus faecigallinarum]|uniref:Uncharacterized protein n=1 Tax=Candidatus Levilactobacillus faecigallinarum TaxID=2838638 RepID=A0A9D1U571_9LACO|nr:hypothetical protein [Candidatus Levilactobacillus faecigallinarum]